MMVLRAPLATALLVLGGMTPDLRAQPLAPSVTLLTYIRPAEYLHEVYAEPAAGANYLFYPDDPAGFEVAVVNRSHVAVSIRLDSDPSTQVQLRIADPAGGSQRVERQWWVLPSAGIRMQGGGGPDVDVAAGSAVVLQPDASLLFAVGFTPAAEWPRGAVAVTADVSIACEPACAVVPFANVFRFEIRPTLERVDRIEQAYRRALRAFLAKDLDSSERALRTLDAEHPGSLMSQLLHAWVARERSDAMRALRYYHAAEGMLLSRSDELAMKRMGTGFDDFLYNIRTSIQLLEAGRR